MLAAPHVDLAVVVMMDMRLSPTEPTGIEIGTSLLAWGLEGMVVSEV